MTAVKHHTHPSWRAFVKVVVVALVLGVAIGAAAWGALALLWDAIWGAGPQFLPG